jgi:hypothetical protein
LRYLSQKRSVGVAQKMGPEFKPQYCKIIIIIILIFPTAVDYSSKPARK